MGKVIAHADLTTDQQRLVNLAWTARGQAKCSVTGCSSGAAVLAQNADGMMEIFPGAGIEVPYFPGTICSERAAAAAAISFGYDQLRCLAVVCTPLGRYLCGICREFLLGVAPSSLEVLNVLDDGSKVRSCTLAELLPTPRARQQHFDLLPEQEKLLIQHCLQLQCHSAARRYPEHQPRGAIFVAANADGQRQVFHGPDGYFGRASPGDRAEFRAESAARHAGFTNDPVLVITARNEGPPVNGQFLHHLKQFYPDCRILLVYEDHVVDSSLTELFPE